ncbi:MAG TPA: MBL fold metallo-hydrolase [Candidatus Ozemobacteraceae bacterium]|nr:MBL fold metallo-hydrolase [Candidatus Ozemobacteraceae bacterium]
MTKFGYEQKSFQSKKTNFVFAALLILVVFVWALLVSPDHGGLVSININPELRVEFINVGQGDAILVRTPMGKNYLIDGGANVPVTDARREGRELVHNYLRSIGVGRLDGVVITHWHNDHLGGLLPVLRLYDVDVVYEPPGKFETEAFKDFEAICSKQHIKRITTKAGDVLEWGNELFVQVLHPEKPLSGKEYSDVNNLSIVLLLRYGRVQLFLAGDIEEDAEREIMKYGEPIKSQVLKVPHHGADTSDYFRFLQMVSPEIGIIMVGASNAFRHPSSRTLSNYERLGTKIYRTDRHGNIRLFVGGKNPQDYRFKID